MLFCKLGVKIISCYTKKGRRIAYENKRGSIELRTVFCGDLSGCSLPGSELAVSASERVEKGVFVDI